MARIDDIREGQRYKVEGVIRNIRDITDPRRGPFTAVSEVGDRLDATWCIETDLNAATGKGKAFIVMFAGDGDHTAMKLLPKRRG